MKLLFIINPKSGRGRASGLAETFESAVTGAGHHVERAVIGAPGAVTGNAGWRSLADNHDAAIVFGGDGTVHSLLPALAGSASALYHVPMGTENLFARHFGMTREPGTLIRAITAGSTVCVDVGEANGRHFALMCSAGPDAAVVRRLALGRKGSIRHSSYLSPILREVLRPSLGPISVRVDGHTLVDSRRGWLVVANSPMYALGLNPARDALMDDGLLDVIFLPASAATSVAAWYCRAASGSPMRARGAVFRRGAEVIVGSERSTPYQLDGDEGGTTGPAAGELIVRVQAGKLRVLAGASA